jgi:hypothetical protein
VYYNVCILLARWRQTVEMAVPVQHCRETVPAIENTAAPAEPRKKKNRPGQAQRRREGKRKEMEMEREAMAEWARQEGWLV